MSGEMNPLVTQLATTTNLSSSSSSSPHFPLPRRIAPQRAQPRNAGAAGIRGGPMSLTLLQGYSSAEEERDEEHERGLFSDEEGGGTSSSISEEEAEGARRKTNRSVAEGSKPPLDPTTGSSPNSLLPSAFDAFSEVSGPPEFLNNSVEAFSLESRDSQREGGRWDRHRGGKPRKEKKDLPAGVVMEAKAQLVGIHDRVRSDLDGGHLPTSGSGVMNSGESKRVISAANPEPKDAADLLRICLQCGVPKTYTHSRGMVCPICGDRPPADPNIIPQKKKGSTIKDKEKSKRMRGQSSHSTWKSETEMQLRQRFE
uniref:Protein PRRC2A n=1 Tax=Anthurium amnicola TaxID=1678845 RepID=A0A1D1XK50_9ARAE